MITCIGYSDIDKFDKFFRKSTAATTPFTDGISYDYFYPSNQAATYSRDADGYIVINQSTESPRVYQTPQSHLRLLKERCP